MARQKMWGPDGPVLLRLVIAVVLGIVVAVVVGLLGSWVYAPNAGWFVAAAVFVIWTWFVIGRMSPEQTKTHATREDPTGYVSHVILLLASIASLVGVAYLLIAQSSQDATATRAAVVGIAGVAAAWFLVHTVYTLRYAQLYYGGGSAGGVDFNSKEPPAYSDFAYLSFTLGMTYQVSDTSIQTRTIRSAAIRQALLSYLFGAIVLAVTVNLVAGLGSSSGGS